MKPKDVNALNNKKYIANKLNKYCPKCNKNYYVSDYITKCPTCKSLLQYSLQQIQINTPKCPTCGSTQIKKISATSKVFGAAMFGLFSKTAKSQFCCKNCGYKW